MNQRLTADEVLAPLARLAIRLNRLPSYADIRLHKRSDAAIPNDKTIANHFGEVSNLREALRGYSARTRNDALALLIPPAEERKESLTTAVDGQVYLLKSGSYYKIGRTDNVARRITEIRLALPERVELIHAINTDDPVGIEAYWHRRFADKRKNGEWFGLAAADVRAFLRRKFQ